ncbi:DUF1071 domain-containing protein [Bacillus cereus]|uniref:Gp28 n=2 Tax=Lwoffvirus TP21 TaxID=57478 RepID=B8R893_9CAUD|nr:MULTISPECIES: DUF1071 domain-containing protein [Bacillus cereus group]YP_002333589.1 Sak-like ssDNA annealing protein [Bacillus phage TP21-L]ANT40043.1 hypothetical protein BMBtpLA3_8 [Bacillus phage BMBtpLA3]ACJ70554.1 gp28 [Bacillus phage TP21-L]EXY08871.1 hypothetical protein BF15_04665 [Bacillus thuringiensis]MEB8551229.1 DUF1071 domain-containing protein [Bacillus cereus]MEB8636808.1 DUF1071 domain-containing protein [Bacillus cereus]
MTETKNTEVAPDQIEVTEEEVNHFKRMFALNVNDKLEKKNGLSYLSWAWAWAETKKIDPRAKQHVHYFPYEGNIDVQVPYLKTPNGFFVQVSVTIHGHTETEMLPVLDHRNKPIANPNAFEINKNQKRCLVKAIALHGLGLYVYAGEDIPEGAEGGPKTLAEKTNQGSRNNEVDKLKKIVTAKKFALAKQKNCDVKAIDGSLSKRIVGWTSYTNDPSLLEQAKKILEEQGA